MHLLFSYDEQHASYTCKLPRVRVRPMKCDPHFDEIMVQTLPVCLLDALEVWHPACNTTAAALDHHGHLHQTWSLMMLTGVDESSGI